MADIGDLNVSAVMRIWDCGSLVGDNAKICFYRCRTLTRASYRLNHTVRAFSMLEQRYVMHCP